MNELRVRDVMTHLVVSFKPSDPISDVAKRLAQNSISGGPVVDGGKVVGMISEADVIAALMPPVRTDRGPSILDVIMIVGRARTPSHKHGLTAAEVMSPMVVQIGADASVWEAASLMERRGVKRLPVVDDEDFLLGIVSRADLVGAMARSDADIEADVREAASILGEENFDRLRVKCEAGVVSLRGSADRRSTQDLLVGMARRTPGVVEVVDRLSSDYDDLGEGKHALRIDPRLNWTLESHPAEEVHP